MITKSDNVFNNNNLTFLDYVVKYEISHGLVFSAALLVLACWCSNVYFLDSRLCPQLCNKVVSISKNYQVLVGYRIVQKD